MEFWQENKLFVVVAGLALLVLVILWPSVFGLGPTVVSLHRGRYNQTMVQHRSIESKIAKFFPKGNKFIPAKRAIKDVEATNGVLRGNVDEMRNWMTFVPRFPFRIPEPRKANERQRYVSLCYTYALNGELMCEEYKNALLDPSDGILWLAGTRNIPLRDTVFGLPGMGNLEAITDPEDSIAKIALIHELGHLAIRLNVDEITSITPALTYTWSIKDTEVATVHPMNVHIKCDLPTLTAFLHALDGAHGQVTRVAYPGGAPPPPVPAVLDAPAPEPEDDPDDAIRPLAAKPVPEPAAPAGPADDPEDPGGPAAPADPPEAEQTRLTIRLDGNPSFFTPDPELGTLKERLTVFRPRDDGAIFVATALVTKSGDQVAPLLEVADILDWRALASALKKKGEPSASRPPDPADTERPYQRIWGFLPPDVRVVLKETASGRVLDDARRTAIVAALNDVLRRRDFYREREFRRVSVPAAIKGLSKTDRDALPDARVHRLNRLLLEAAFPRELARVAYKVEAVLEPTSDICFVKGKKEPTRTPVVAGDLAATRFFFLRSMKVASVAGTIEKDRDGFPVEVTPPHLDVELSVGALNFAGIKAEKAVEKKPKGPKLGTRRTRPL